MEPLVTGWWVEVIGYVGMALVLISFLMKEAKYIRMVNLAGSVLSCAYGIMTVTIPTAALNGSLMVINATFLIVGFINASKKTKEENAKKAQEQAASEASKEEKE